MDQLITQEVIKNYLLPVCANLTSDIIVSVTKKIRDYISKEKNPNVEGLKNELVGIINQKDVQIVSERLLSYMANDGYIKLEGVKAYANSISVESSGLGTIDMSKDTVLQSNTGSGIGVFGGGKFIQSGNATTIIDDQGNIKFTTNP